MVEDDEAAAFALRTAEISRLMQGHPLASFPAARDAEGALLWEVGADLPPLRTCRSDSEYVWQAHGGEAATYEEGLRCMLRAVAIRDRWGFLTAITPEDGALGVHCAVGEDGATLLSRDLIDSANELCFLEESCAIRGWRAGTTLLDIGAGYGRFVHRAAAALPHLQ